MKLPSSYEETVNYKVARTFWSLGWIALAAMLGLSILGVIEFGYTLFLPAIVAFIGSSISHLLFILKLNKHKKERLNDE